MFFRKLSFSVFSLIWNQLRMFPSSCCISCLSQIQRLCRSTRAFMIFPLEREADLSRLVGYERYV